MDVRNLSKNDDEPRIFRTVSHAPTAVELEAIIGSIAGVIGIIVTLLGVYKLYYLLSFHCKGKVKDVRVTVVPNKGRKIAYVSWVDPERSKFQQVMCITKNYKISCKCCKECQAETMLHFLEKDKASIEIQEYMEHRLQVTVCYTGRLIQADHWSETSDATEPNCIVLAPPSKPVITNIGLNQRRLPTFEFQKPKRENGFIVDYILRIKKKGNLEGKDYPVNAFPLESGLLTATPHVPLQSGQMYQFSIAAINLKEKRECLGEWSEEKEFMIPDECVADPNLSWKTEEWGALQDTVIARIGTEIESLALMLGFNDQEVQSVAIKCNTNQTYLRGMAIDFLTLWKRRVGARASLGALHSILQEIRMISLADLFKQRCNKAGLEV